MSVQRYMSAAETAAQIIPGVLAERGLQPLITRFLLVETAHGSAWLFAALDTMQSGKLEAYQSPDVVHHLSTALRGRPVVVSNSSGFRYAVLLSERPSLPKTVDFPGWRSGLAQIGVGLQNKQIGEGWEGLGHILAGGMTGSGKSNFLRLLVIQAMQEGFALALADPDGRTFPQLAGSPSLIAPLGQTPDGCEMVVSAALAEITRRSRLYDAAPGYPDNLEAYNAIQGIEPLPRLLVVIDEFNGLVLATGGAKGSLAQAATQLAWRGRKFGVTLVLAGQDFTKEIVGPVRDQMTTRVCFRVANASTSRVVIGQSGAEKLKTPGRAWSDRWGLFQAYRADLSGIPASDGLSVEEKELAARLLAEHEGKMTFDVLGQLGYSRRAADRLRRDWLARGLAVVRPEEDNALFVDKTRFLRANEQTEKTG